ncbi:hypothetical protein CC80DRAFT_165408 [Byssothecium circinans]|uniref:Rhodopsin domain-containing protein n=1 Tax=Byssothecium circinans TaxID=147558 RepID=A0A6A5TLJ5_9PLEO|nr:hypothetical protein CC80DRAFT_165408 [Byssothecium circinans]
MTTHMDPALIATLPDNSNPPISNKPETIRGVTLTFIGIALTAVSLRMFVRWKGKIWGWDDLFVVLAAIAVTTGSILICMMPDDGLGRHYYLLTDAEITAYFKHIWATNITYAFSASCIKIAILTQYLRLFGNQQLLARKLCFGLLTFVALWGVAFTLLAVFSCQPVAKNWKPMLPGKCVGWGSKVPETFFAMFVGHSASNACLDILVLLLPMPFFKKLRLSGKSRLGLMSLFSMGGIVVVLAAARVVSLCIKRAGTVPIFDPTFATPTVYIFSVLEINVAIMCASIPIFWPLVTSLASNKILIVNEIEVRSERRSENIDLVEHGKDSSYMNIGEIDGRNSRASILGGFDSGKPSPSSDTLRSPSHLTRTRSRNTATSTHTHRHNKHSSSSSKDALGISVRTRPSHDSDRTNRLLHQSSTNSFGSSNRNIAQGVDCGGADHTHAKYKDSYNQGWAVPDFDKVVQPASPTFHSSAQRAQVPFDHIGALKK